MLAVSFVYIDRYRDVIRVYEERDQAALLHRSTYRTKAKGSRSFVLYSHPSLSVYGQK